MTELLGETREAIALAEEQGRSDNQELHGYLITQAADFGVPPYARLYKEQRSYPEQLL